MLDIKRRALIYTLFIVFVLLSLVIKFTPLAQLNDNENPVYSEKDLLVHYIDVGQGDAILIQIKNKNLLIDSGPAESSDKVIQYLKSHRVHKLDYIVITHPHEDHMGSMSDVIKKFKVGTIYAPKKSASTSSFENLVNALRNKELKINIAKPNLMINLESNISAFFIGPPYSNYDDINNFSAIVKINFGSTKFLFMGDAEKLVENQLIEKKIDVSADVIKIGHHGSNSSSSSAFIEKVNPKYAVISSGKNNDYGHPHKEVLDYLKSKKVAVYRTDENNDIILRSNGTSIIKE